MTRKNTRTTYSDIAPDEIFIDASNLPLFDTYQFEGSIEKPIRKQSLYYFGAVAVLLLVAFVIKSGMLQIAKGEEYLAIAEQNRLDKSIIFADRGVLYDRNNVLLAWNEAGDDEYAVRTYTERAGFSHILGYVTSPKKDKYGEFFKYTYDGVAGVERLYNDQLLGENGLTLFETNAQGERESEYSVSPPKDGTNLVLSIDSRVQETLHSLIERTAKERGFGGGAGVIMDVTTGEIISLVSYPEYNSNNLAQGDTKSIQSLLDSEQKPFLNRAISGLYAPGSIVKPYMAAAALTEGTITPNTVVHSTGKLIIPNPYFPDQPTVYSDWGAPAHGDNEVTRALAISSNVFFLSVGGGANGIEGLGIERIEKYMRMFGFGDVAGLPLSEEVRGTIPSPAWKKNAFDTEWRLGDTYLTSIGQYGFQVSPLQVARAVASIASGSLVTPVLVQGAMSTTTKLAIDDSAFALVRKGMRRGVLEGTAGGLNVPYVSVAAKTGTAELGVSKANVNSWVTGFFPYEKPRYAFVILMERGPRSNTIGGVYVMRGLLDWMHVNTPEYFATEP